MSMATIQPQVELLFNCCLLPVDKYAGHHLLMQNDTGNLIRMALRRIGKTQRWLGEQCGVTDQAVSKWVRTGEIHKDRIHTVADLLGINVMNLLPQSNVAPQNSRPGYAPPSDPFISDAMRVRFSRLTPEGQAHARARLLSGIEEAEAMYSSDRQANAS